MSIYIYLNVLNISSVDRGRVGTGSGSEKPEAGLGEPKVAVSSALAGSFPLAVAPLGAESLSGSLGTAEPL